MIWAGTSPEGTSRTRSRTPGSRWRAWRTRWGRQASTRASAMATTNSPVTPRVCSSAAMGEVVQVGQSLLRIGQEDFAQCRQERFTTVLPLEEGAPDLVLQAGDPPRERRLAGVETLGCGRERAVGDDLDEGTEIVGFGQRHDRRPGTPPTFVMCPLRPRCSPAAAGHSSSARSDDRQASRPGRREEPRGPIGSPCPSRCRECPPRR